MVFLTASFARNLRTGIMVTYGIDSLKNSLIDRYQTIQKIGLPHNIKKFLCNQSILKAKHLFYLSLVKMLGKPRVETGLVHQSNSTIKETDT